MLAEMNPRTDAFPHAVTVTRADKDRLLAGTPLVFRLAANMLLKIRYGAFVFVLPDGRAFRFEGEEEKRSVGVFVVRDWAFVRRSLLGGDVGLFESYADDQWDSPSVADMLYVFARNADHVTEAFLGSPLLAWAKNLRHRLNRNTRAGARRNIIAHYDLGNSFYEKWLDRTMTYSSALFPDDKADLSAAQENKYRALARAIDLRAGDRVLEIGCGWGGFAEFAARETGATVTGLTISPAQLDYAARRIQREGLGEKVRFELRDYRDVEGRFDKVASIEMFEAVGREYWPAYFSKVRDVLEPGGVAGFQIITIADRLFEHYASGADFIQRYIFPGGMLPSRAILAREIAGGGLALRRTEAFGPDYARTLAEWRRRFLAAWNDIRPLGFDGRFRKLWNFYLSYCEAGFRAATTDVVHVTAARHA